MPVTKSIDTIVLPLCYPQVRKYLIILTFFL